MELLVGAPGSALDAPANNCYLDLQSDIIAIAYLERSPQRHPVAKQKQRRAATPAGSGVAVAGASAGASLLGPKGNRNSCWVFRYDATRSLLNRLSTWYYSFQTYVHCEIAFIYKDRRTAACRAYGVFADEGVFRRDRTFQRDGYHWIFLRVTEQEHLMIYNWCDGQYGKPFDRQGAFRSAFWPVGAYERKGWWCIAMVVSALQQASIMSYYNAEGVDVDDLVNFLRDHPRKIDRAAPMESSQIATGTYKSPLFEEQ